MIERATRASGGSFGSATAEDAFHGTSDLHPTSDKVPSSIVENIDCYLGNLAAAATKEKYVIKRIMANK